MSHDIGKYLWSINNALQEENMPFIGDLYSTSKDVFYQTNCTLYIKTLKVSTDEFYADVVLGGIDWSQAGEEYDQLIVGVDITAPNYKSKLLKGSWSLTGQVREHKVVDLLLDNCDLTFKSFAMMPRKFYRVDNNTSQPKTSFSLISDLEIFVSNLSSVRSAIKSIANESDSIILQEISQNSKSFSRLLNTQLTDWVNHVSGIDWAVITRAFIEQNTLVETFIKSNRSEMNRIDRKYQEKQLTIDFFSKKGINYVNSDEEWKKILSQHVTVAVLLFRNDLLISNSKVTQFFNEYMKSCDTKMEFCAVDLDLVDNNVFDSPPKNSVLVQMYEDGKCSNRNLMLTLRNTKKNIATYGGEWLQILPSKRAILNLPCPRYGCPSEQYNWFCAECEGDLYYTFDDHIYCNHCGSGSIKSFKFQCSSLDHLDAILLTPKLIEDLNKMVPMNERNILILGQSGVGKSTWINAVTNYMLFKTLDNAERYEVKAPIPSKFSITDRKLNTRTICIGDDDDNENRAVGESATQDCRCYSVVLNNVVINLIDSPGIGDSRGPEEDQKNIEKVLDYVRHINLLHGICLLLKPNEARLSILFQYCLKELLCKLHQSASNNLLFCFTNARQTFYQPGESLPILKQYLRDIGVNFDISDRIFCLDNEAFRYLCIKNVKDVEFSDDEQADFAKSWAKSVDETTRLLEKVNVLKPHATASTVSLNHARRLILSLTRPIGDITRLIEDNIYQLRVRQDELRWSNQSIEQLRANRLVRTCRFKAVELGYPRTVCTVCVEKRSVGNTTETLYVTHCHPHCYLSGVIPKTHPNPDLKGCAAMGGGYNCTNCSCSWETHMHILYDMQMEEVLEESVNIRDQLKNAKTVAEAKNLLVTRQQQLVDQHEKEKKEIFRIASFFAVFLKQEAIVAYNDSLGDYLGFLIRVQQLNKEKTSTDIARIEKLEENKKIYLKEVELFHKKPQFVDKKITPQDIEHYENALYQLPTYGKQLKQVLEVAMSAENNAARYTTKVVSSKLKQSKKTPSLITSVTGKLKTLFTRNDHSGHVKKINTDHKNWYQFPGSYDGDRGGNSGRGSYRGDGRGNRRGRRGGRRGRR